MGCAPLCLPCFAWVLQIYERENEALRASREEVQAECSRLRARLDAVQAARDALSVSQRTAAADAEAALSELRTQLKMKAFEHESLVVAHDEQGACLRAAKSETDCAQEQLKVLRKEFTLLETKMLRERAELQAQLTAEVRMVVGVVPVMSCHTAVRPAHASPCWSCRCLLCVCVCVRAARARQIV